MPRSTLIPFIVFIPIICLQSAFISYLLVNQQQANELEGAAVIRSAFSSQPEESSSFSLLKPNEKFITSEHDRRPISSKTFKGVATTLMINSPKWFQRRYTSMITNILMNTPSDWALQIFYFDSGQSQFGLDINPGIQRLNNTLFQDRIIFTKLPKAMVEKKGPRRKLLYWTDEWIWNQLVSDRVLVFSGNGCVCSNSHMSMLDGSAMESLLDRVDFVGSPSRELWGRGGAGDISYRNRTAMLDAIRYKEHDGNEREDYFFIKTLLEMNKHAGEDVYRVATKEQTQLFGGTINVTEESGPPMVVSGILPRMEHDDREQFLLLCPELKIIFPSLHNPNCFGASLNAEECARHICALKNSTERKSGC